MKQHKQHKWHKEIKAWADGAEIEHKHTYQDEWKSVTTPNWAQSLEFRIKPQPKEPRYLYVYSDEVVINFSWQKAVFKNGVPLVGKIKLEVDDE